MKRGERPVALITGGRGLLARALAAELRGAGWEVVAPAKAALDVREEASIRQVVAGLGRIDLLVNNAGLRRDAPLGKLAAGDWGEVLDVNLKGAWRCARAVWPTMQRQGGGHIVNIGSYTARHGVAGQSAYGAAKAGLLGLTQSLAAEGGPEDIRVNAVLPGWMPGPFTAGVAAAAEEAVRGQHYLQRFNTPEQAARFVVFLHSLGHTSGQVFQIDSRPGSWG